MAALSDLKHGVWLRDPRLGLDIFRRAKRPTARSLQDDLILAVREHADADRAERVRRLTR